MNHSSRSLLLVFALALFACGNPPPGTGDASSAGPDAAGAAADVGPAPSDAAELADTGAGEPDGGPAVTPPDAGSAADTGGTPAPFEVTKAKSESTTSVIVEFNRAVDPGTVLPNGSQFTLTGGLTASAASASGSQVRVTTSTQTPGADYVVTVASTVLDTGGEALSSSANSAGFITGLGQAKLVINEVNPNIPNSRDLIEFLVVEAGTTKQMQVIEEGKLNDPLAFTTFPDVAVEAGDLVVLHLNAVDAADPKASERTSKSESAAANAYPNAWDFVGGSAAVTWNHRVLKLVAADGTVQDVVPFAKVGAQPPLPGGFEFAVQFAQANGQWTPADCGGALCTYVSTPSVLDVSVDWSQVGNTKDSSLARKAGGTDTNSKDDWGLKTAGASFGAANP